jgi:hypothetical protein
MASTTCPALDIAAAATAFVARDVAGSFARKVATRCAASA